MSKWITGSELIKERDIKPIDLFEYITLGLQPHDEYGRAIESPEVSMKLNLLNDQEKKLKELQTYQNEISSESYIKDKMERYEKLMAISAVPSTGKIPGSISKPSIPDIEKIKKQNEDAINKLTESIGHIGKELSRIKNKTSWKDYELPELEQDIKEVFKIISNAYYLRSDAMKFMEDVYSEPDIQVDTDLEPDREEITNQHTVPVYSFYRNGQKWMIGEKGKEVIFDHLIGFEFIRFLIRHEEEYFNPLQVYHIGNVPDEIKHLLYEISYHKYGDSKTITSIKNHKEKLDAEYVIETDPQKLQELQYKINQCDRYVKKAREGFPRKMNAYGSNVRKSIKRAVETIISLSREYPTLKPLEKHLCLVNPDKRIKTGDPCWYRPDPENPVEWVLEPEINN
jgi:hypothetical protein